MKKWAVLLCFLLAPLAVAAAPDVGVAPAPVPAVVADAGTAPATPAPVVDAGIKPIMVVPVVDAGTPSKAVVDAGVAPAAPAPAPAPVVDAGTAAPAPAPVKVVDGGETPALKPAPMACATTEVSVGTTDAGKAPAETVVTAPKPAPAAPVAPVAPVVAPAAPVAPKAVETPKAAAPVASTDAQQAATAVQGAIQAAKQGKWAVLAGLIITLLLVIIRRIPVLDLIPKKIVPWVAVGLGVIGYIGVALSSGTKIEDALVQGILTGLAGVGIWETIFTHILKKSDTAPAAPKADDEKAGPTA